MPVWAWHLLWWLNLAVSSSLTACWSAVLCMMFVPQHEARSEMSEREVARLQKMLERMEGGFPKQSHSQTDTVVHMHQAHSSQETRDSNTSTLQLSQHQHHTAVTTPTPYSCHNTNTIQLSQHQQCCTNIAITMPTHVKHMNASVVCLLISELSVANRLSLHVFAVVDLF